MRKYNPDTQVTEWVTTKTKKEISELRRLAALKSAEVRKARQGLKLEFEEQHTLKKYDPELKKVVVLKEYTTEFYIGKKKHVYEYFFNF